MNSRSFLYGASILGVAVFLGASEWRSFGGQSTPPSISSIPPQRAFPGLPTRPIPFTVGDDQTPAADLVLAANSGNEALMPGTNIVFGGSSNNRTLTLTPASGLKGSCLVSIVVTDGDGNSATNSFSLTVADFTPVAQLTGLSSGSASWVDYDNDGNLDFLVTGRLADRTASTQLYRNYGGGAFYPVYSPFPYLEYSAPAWGDYDGDGYMDLLISGEGTSGAGPYTYIYHNNGGSAFGYVTALGPVYFGGVAWGDIDNDGDLDPLLGGRYSMYIYHNNGGNVFTNVTPPFPSGYYMFGTWADYDNDGDLDWAESASASDVGSRLFRQDAPGVFTPVTLATNSAFQCAAWGDFNNDGYLDLVAMATDATRIYRNEGNGTFTQLPATLPGAGYCSVAWGDFNNDGYLDLLLAGSGMTRIYRNDGAGNFTLAWTAPLELNESCAVFGDYDNDGALDVLVIGVTNDVKYTTVYHNDGAMPNTPPAAPGNLGVQKNGRLATLTWTAATDAEQNGGLSYNVRLGATPGTANIIAPGANLATGQRRVPALGNCGTRLNYSITNLSAGTYYWSVQAIDQTYAGSPFASEQSFTISLPVITNQPQALTVFAGETATLSVGASGTDPLAYQWKFYGTNISGATNSTFVLTNAQFINQGLYSVVVSDVVGSTNSSSALLTVNSAPVITAQPRGQAVPVGGNGMFSVSVIGNQPFSYQWFFGVTELPGETNATLTVTNVQFANAGNYSVRVTNWVGAVTSDDARLNVYPLGVGLQSISAPAAVDMVYDDARDIMYISSGNAILRYCVSSNLFLTPFQMGTTLAGLDLSPDGNTLVVGDHDGGSTNVWVFVVDLKTGQSRQVSFARGWEYGIYWLAYGNDNAVLTTSDWGINSGSSALRRYEPATDNTTNIMSVFMRSRPTASGDGSVIVIGEGSVSSGNVFKYNVATRQIAGTAQCNQFSWIHPGANRNGTQFTYSMDSGTYVINSNMSVIYTIGGPYLAARPVGLVYHPAQDLMFVAWAGSRVVRALETINFTEVARYDFGFDFGSSERTTYRMRISRDGTLLMARTGGDGINSVWGGISYLRLNAAPPTISAQPASTSAFFGSNATFTVQAIGTPPFNYQWRFSGTNLSGATDASLILTNLQPNQAGGYSVLVCNPAGCVTSSVATLTLDGAPIITVQPTNQTVIAGDGVSFSVAAVGTTPFTYQWLLFGTNFSGPNANPFTIADAQAANAGDYSVILNNTYGSATSSVATLTVTPTAPVITQQPLTQRIPAGENLILTVAAKGTEPLSYQWRFKGADLPGQTGTSLTLVNLQAEDAGDYVVVVSNSVNVTLSDTATLTVTPVGPTITSFPASRSVPVGAEVSFSTAAKGTEPLSFQWRFYAGDIPGGTNATLTVVNVQSNNAGSYSVLVTNDVGSALSTPATLSISPPPGFLWARHAGGTGTDMGNCVAMDTAGNAYVAGSFSGAASFGPTNLVSAGSWDVFIAKYDPLGQLLWVRQAGGTANDAATGVALDPSGNVFVTGNLEGTADFEQITLTNRGGADIFIAKYTGDGALLWATNAGGTGTDQGYAVAADASGNALVCGTFSGTATFGTTNLSSLGGIDAFVACYTPGGNVAWVRRVGGAGTDVGRAVACDRAGNVCLAGDFSSSTVTAGSITLTNRSNAGGGFSDLFLVKYDAAGTLLWAAQGTGANSETPRGLATDDAGNILLAGYYVGAASFGGLPALTNAGNSDLFLAKFDPAGKALWARGAGGSGQDYAYAVAADAGGNAFVTGRLNYTVRFGATNSFASSGDDAFVAMYTAAGNFQWVRRTSGVSTEYGLGISADSAGRIYVSGVYDGVGTFGHASLTSFGGSDAFLTKLAAYDLTAAPVFTLHPSNQVAQAGANVAFNLGFIGPGPASFQWLFNGTNIAGATNFSLVVSNAGLAQAGAYSAIVSNANGAITSAVASLTISVEPDFLWALRAGGAINDEAFAVAADTNGNTYVAGYFSGIADFGGEILTSRGGEDIFIAKYDGAQNLVWVRQAGGSGNDRANAIALDDTGTNLLVAGSFSGMADFSGQNVTSAGGTDIFIASCTTDGNRRWIQSWGGPGDDTALGLAMSANGRFFVTGSFQGNAIIAGANLNSAGTNDMFVAKFSTSAGWFWARAGGGSGDDRGRAVTCDCAGNVFVAGAFSGAANFSGASLVSVAALDAFVVKYDSNGNRLWARRAGTSLPPAGGGSYNDEATAIASDPDGNVFISGYFNNQATFGTNVLTAALTNQPDIFLAKYDAGGNVLWAQAAGGVLPDAGSALVTDPGGNAYLAGSFSGTARFGPASASSLGGTDMFVAMYDATGRLIKVRRGGSVGDDAGLAVALDGRGDAVVGGSYAAPAAFGGFTLNNSGSKDAFVTKVAFFDPDTAPVITSQPAGVSTTLGSNVVLQVGVSSGTALQCQWFFQGGAIPGATNLSLSLANLQYDRFGDYSVVLSNAFGLVTSVTARVTIEVTPELLWALRFGSSGEDQALAMAVDSATNIVVAGTFSGTVGFGAWGLVSSGGTDIFLVKFNAAGGVVWARRAGGTGTDSPLGLALGDDGDVFLTGLFSGTASFGSSNVVSSGNTDFFVARYDVAGNLVWVKRAGGMLYDQGSSVAADAGGNAYVTGSYYSGANFGGIGLTNLNSTNFFLAKYDPAGNVVWAKTAAGTNACQGNGVAVDAATNVYVTGFISGWADFGSGMITNTNNAYFNGTAFVAKYDRDGVLQWAKKGGTNGLGYGQTIVTDPYGYIYATSYRRDYGYGVTLTKYDSGGNLLWYRPTQISCCTGDSIQAPGIALDPTGNPVVTGAPTWSATLEGLSLSRQGFVVKYRASDGAPFWIQRLGTMGYGAAVDTGGNEYLVGRFSGTATFGASSNLTSAGLNDVFLVKFGLRPPAFSVFPDDRLVVAGSNATIQVGPVTGTGPLAYQWQLNGTNVANATGSSLNLNSFGAANAGRYSLVVWNPAGAVTNYVGARGLIPVLSVTPIAGGTVLRWDGNFTLQSAANLAGPYLDLPPAASPYTNLFAPDDPQRFFRLRVSDPLVTGAMLPNQRFKVGVAGSPGRMFLVDTSTNLVDWMPMWLDAAPFEKTDTESATLPQRFYRARLAR